MRSMRCTDKPQSLWGAIEFFLILFGVLLLLTMLPAQAQAAGVLTWVLPSTHTNGSPLTPIAADVVTLTRDGGAPILLPGTATTYTDANVADCKAHQWTATYTETATTLTSTQATATQAIDTVGCAPKSITALQIK